MRGQGQWLPTPTDIRQQPLSIAASQGQCRGTLDSQTLRIPLPTLSLASLYIKGLALLPTWQHIYSPPLQIMLLTFLLSNY